MSHSEQMNGVDLIDALEHANIQNPFPLFTKLRSEAPVYWSQKYSFWMVNDSLSNYAGKQTIMLWNKNRACVMED